MGALLTILEGIMSLWGWFKGNKDQQVGQQKQQLADDEAKLREAKDLTDAQNAVQDKTVVELDADLAKRVRDTGHD